MDKITVIVEKLTNDYINLTIPYQSGIMADYEKYQEQQATNISLTLNEKYTLHLDVYDAMESWEISFVEKNTEENMNKDINPLDFLKSKIAINDTYIDENGHERDEEKVFEIVSLSEKIKKDWSIEEMPEQNVEFEIDRLLAESEIEILKKGHKPAAMEDKWFWYVENNILNVHRSWTGICIFKIELNTNGKLKVIANRNPEQYKEKSVDKDRVY